jgi:hypothetical protein
MSILAPAPAQTGLGCRVWERYPCDLQTACQPIASRNDKDLVWAATIRNISVAGVGLVLPRRFEKGMGLAIEVPGQDGGDGETLLARVIHVRRQPDGGWFLGCQFISQLSEQELERLLELADSRRAAEAPAGDGTAGKKTVVVENVAFQAEAADAQNVRLRVKRLVLTGHWPPPPGTVLRVNLPATGNIVKAHRVRVTRCWKQDGQWTVAYRFADTPSADLQRLFGHA